MSANWKGHRTGADQGEVAAFECGAGQPDRAAEGLVGAGPRVEEQPAGSHCGGCGDRVQGVLETIRGPPLAQGWL